MSVTKIAEPYAEALLELANSSSSLKETTNDMNIVSQFLTELIRYVEHVLQQCDILIHQFLQSNLP